MATNFDAYMEPKVLKDTADKVSEENVFTIIRLRR
jgi:hypothetical protein